MFFGYRPEWKTTSPHHPRHGVNLTLKVIAHLCTFSRAQANGKINIKLKEKREFPAALTAANSKTNTFAKCQTRNGFVRLGGPS